MQTNGFLLSNYELDILFCRFDKNNDRKIAFNEVNVFNFSNFLIFFNFLKLVYT